MFLLQHGMHIGHVISGVANSAIAPVMPVMWVHRNDISPSRVHLLRVRVGVRVRG